MKIIDSHLHFSFFGSFDETAIRAGHENTPENLLKAFEEEDIVAAVAMGSGSNDPGQDVSPPLTINLNGEFDFENYNQPKKIVYCCGVDSTSISKENMSKTIDLFANHLEKNECVGLKMYPGYRPFYLDDEIHYPFYDLARQFNVPVVIHTGDTANSRGLLKYSHPLTVDDIAVKFHDVTFVMAHYGNPWIVDATEVAKKNDNVFVDLSGLVAGQFDVDWFFTKYKGYCDHLTTWMTYLSDYGKFMYGSDWPLVNINTYIKLIKRLIPEKYHEQVFYENAKRIFSKIGNIID